MDHILVKLVFQIIQMDKEANGFIYKVGMFGTCANPLHQGHVSVITKAASECQELYVVISYSQYRDEIDINIRHKWIEDTFTHLSNITIIHLEDDASSKELYSDEHW